MQRTHSLGSAVCRGPAPLAASPETFQGPGCGSRAFTALCVYGVGVSVSVCGCERGRGSVLVDTDWR